MATGVFLDKEETEGRLDDTVVSGTVNGSGHLILTTAGGATIDAGLVKGTATAEDVDAEPNTLVKRNFEGRTKMAPPEEADDVAIKATVDALQTALLSRLPAGFMSLWPIGNAPAGYLTCNGALVSRTTYAELFAVIGTTYGAGDGSTTFALPDLRGRVPVGLSTGQTEFDTIGKSGGAKTHILSVSEMPSHTHTQNSHNHTQNSHNHTQNSHEHANDDNLMSNGYQSTGGTTDNGGNSFASGLQTARFSRVDAGTKATTATNQAATATNQAATATNQNTGGGDAHNNLQPYRVVTYIIKT